MNEFSIDWADRYGGDWPDPSTVCNGPCEGMGIYPENDPELVRESGKEPDEIGFVFLTCPDCGGSGKIKK